MKNTLVLFVIMILCSPYIQAQDCFPDPRAEKAKDKMSGDNLEDDAACRSVATFYTYLCECESKPHTKNQIRNLEYLLNGFKEHYNKSENYCPDFERIDDDIPKCMEGTPEESYVNASLLFINGPIYDESLVEVKQIVEDGFDVNTEDNKGETALFTAVYKENIDIVEYLLLQGANPNIENEDGQTALTRAVWTENTELIEYLLSQGADPNKGNVLFHSVRMGESEHTPELRTKRKKILLLLLEHGADPTLRNLENKEFSAIEAAKTYRIAWALKIFKEEGF